MEYSMQTQLSNEDAQLSELNQLGRPLDIYRIRPGYIRFLYGSGLCFIILGGILLASIIARIIIGMPNAYSNDVLTAVPLVIVSIGVLLCGFVVLGIALPSIRSERVLMCEQGLLQIKKRLRSNYVEAVRWNDILAIKRGAFSSYYILRRGKTALSLAFYQKADELVELIRQQNGVA